MSKKLTTEQFIEKAKKIHGDKYDYSKVEYIDAKTKVKIICPEHGEFWMSPNKHLLGQKCKMCSIKEFSKTQTLTTEQFMEKAKKIQGDKYDYSKVNYINSQIKICIICPEHGEFWQTPNSHLQGNGCPICATNNRSMKQTLTTEQFIEKAKQIHGNKYDYSKVEYVNNHTKVCIICPEHGEFWQTPHKHTISKHGCPACGGSIILNNKTFIEKARKIHGDKYDYSQVNYINNRKKVCIICNKKNKNGIKHGEFWQEASSHLQGVGCPKCSVIVSDNEKEIVEYCKMLTNDVIENERTILNGKELDIYMQEYNIAIEYNGLKWHSEQFGKDKNYHLDKTEKCQKNGIRLIHIFEDEWLEHKEVVKSKIKHILKKDNDLQKVYARKCVVKEIDKDTSREFLEKNHIQGFSPSTIYIGCFFNNELIGVMTFKKERKEENKWELNRFATDITKQCVGVGGKLFQYFVKNYNPEYIKSFADRRWTLDKDNNLYTKLGFELEKILKPDYHYVYGNKRIHKFNFRKKNIIKLFKDKKFTLDMTEKEMMSNLSIFRIWDCGLFKFIWKK